jgi:ketosteroid isomerase-like protein
MRAVRQNLPGARAPRNRCPRRGTSYICQGRAAMSRRRLIIAGSFEIPKSPWARLLSEADGRPPPWAVQESSRNRTVYPEPGVHQSQIQPHEWTKRWGFPTTRSAHLAGSRWLLWWSGALHPQKYLRGGSNDFLDSPDAASSPNPYRGERHRDVYRMEETMSEHPNVTVINRMTEAALAGDKKTLTECFTEDMALHVRGTFPRVGDHRGVEGFLGVIGTISELTAGDVKLEQQFAIADEGWGAEWERAHFGRNGRTLDIHDAFIYRFEGGRIAEIWMIGAGPAGSESFFE